MTDLFGNLSLIYKKKGMNWHVVYTALATLELSSWRLFSRTWAAQQHVMDSGIKVRKVIAQSREHAVVKR